MDRGPYKPLEERLGGRDAFEAHQKAEAERTARVNARYRKHRRDVLLLLGGTAAIIAAVVAAIYFLT